MDQLVNKNIKHYIKTEFNQWYVGLLLNWIDQGKDVKDFVCDLRWSLIKENHASWLVSSWDKITTEHIKSSFEMCGIGVEESDVDLDISDEYDSDAMSD